MRIDTLAGTLAALALAGCATGAAAPPPTLAGTSWQLERFAGGDDTVLVAGPGPRSTLAFAADGAVAVRIACNRGRATWTHTPPAGIAFGPLALTKMACPPDPLAESLAKQWPYVRSYVLKDGQLHLSLLADGGIYTLAPLR